VGHHLLASAADRPPLDEGEFHLLDLEGLQVRLLADGAVIGTVRDLIHGGNDLLDVELRDGGRRVLIPFVKAIVPEVHLEEGLLSLAFSSGLATQEEHAMEAIRSYLNQVKDRAADFLFAFDSEL
jgi:16S rRNA processing protein RimM